MPWNSMLFDKIDSYRVDYYKYRGLGQLDNNLLQHDHKRIHGNDRIRHTLRLGYYITIIVGLVNWFPLRYIRRYITSWKKCTDKQGNNMVRGITLAQKTAWVMGRVCHEKHIWRNRFSGWRNIGWNIICTSNVHVSRVTSVKGNPSVMLGWGPSVKILPQMVWKVQYDHYQRY